jgi:hypothetical protein
MTRRGILGAGQEGGAADAGRIGKPPDAPGAEKIRRGTPQSFSDTL